MRASNAAPDPAYQPTHPFVSAIVAWPAPSYLVVLIERQAVLVRDRRPPRGEGLLVLRSLVIRHRCGLVVGVGLIVRAASSRDLVLRPPGEVLVSLAGGLPGRGEVLQHRCGQGRAVGQGGELTQ